MAKKKPWSRCSLCGSASTGLAFQIIEASLLHTIPFHPLQLQPCCPNSRPQGVDDPFHDSRSLGSAIWYGKSLPVRWKFIPVMKTDPLMWKIVYRSPENSSLWWNLSIVMKIFQCDKIHHYAENSSLCRKLSTKMKIHQFDENSLM